jgi:hypothetical protein
VVPTLPAGAIVAMWFGSNNGALQLAGPGLAAGRCVNGLNQNGAVSIFGQVCIFMSMLALLTCLVRLLQCSGILRCSTSCSG